MEKELRFFLLTAEGAEGAEREERETDRCDRALLDPGRLMTLFL